MSGCIFVVAPVVCIMAKADNAAINIVVWFILLKKLFSIISTDLGNLQFIQV